MDKKFSSFFFLLLLLLNVVDLSFSITDEFIFHGFSTANLQLDGIASITPNGVLQLTNNTLESKAHAFYPLPFRFKSPSGKARSFSTTFVFAIQAELSGLAGHGIAFFVSPTADFSSALTAEYFGLFNTHNLGNSSNHIFAVEVDSIQNPELLDIDNNHVGIDINSLKSNLSHTAGYYDDKTGSFKRLNLISGQPMQLWVDFNGESTRLDVTLAPMKTLKPKKPLLSSKYNLSSLMLDSMRVGLASTDGPFRTRHYILGWSFNMNGAAQPLNYTLLPSVPVIKNSQNSKTLLKWLPASLCLFLLLVIFATVFTVRRRRKYAELLEDWELEFGPHRFKFKDLFQATKGFKEKELLGTGGFGRVYRGVLPDSNIEVAVKKVSHDSRQGVREFVAEIVSIGQLRHRNIVQLLGYCRRKGELLLVYDFMPNGSLDKFLYDRTKPTLSWAQRFRIIKGVASGLLYLHEDWEQVVVHRDIKASNVLIDGELNGRLGDFGLARLYDRGTDPQTTRVVGTMGYLAPELAMVSKASPVTDVFAFGAFLLEVVCGRRPIEHYGEGEDVVLVDFVLENWRRGTLIEAMDSRLRDEFVGSEVELVLKLGLLCSHPVAAARPRMRQVVQILDGDVELDEFFASSLGSRSNSKKKSREFDDEYRVSFCLSAASLSSLSGGR